MRLPRPPMPLTLNQPLVIGERAGMMVQDRYQAHDGEADEDRVLHRRHADLCSRGDADPDDLSRQLADLLTQ